MEITFLGTGTSHGVPQLLCDCPVCDNARLPNTRNCRTRSSILIHVNHTDILIDTSMDFRQQMLENNVQNIDAVLFSHEHADHIFGLPDIRSFTPEKTLHCYANPRTVKYLRRVFDYIFHPTQIGGGIPSIALNPVSEEFYIGDTKIIPIPVMHGILEVYGYRIHNIAYIPDVSHIPKESQALLTDLQILIMDALKYDKHSTHFSMPESLEMVNTLKPKKAYFTHISHRIDHYNVALPENVELAYDGLRISSDIS